MKSTPIHHADCARAPTRWIRSLRAEPVVVLAVLARLPARDARPSGRRYVDPRDERPGAATLGRPAVRPGARRSPTAPATHGPACRTGRPVESSTSGESGSALPVANAARPGRPAGRVRSRGWPRQTHTPTTGHRPHRVPGHHADRVLLRAAGPAGHVRRAPPAPGRLPGLVRGRPGARRRPASWRSGSSSGSPSAPRAGSTSPARTRPATPSGGRCPAASPPAARCS